MELLLLLLLLLVGREEEDDEDEEEEEVKEELGGNISVASVAKEKEISLFIPGNESVSNDECATVEEAVVRGIPPNEVSIGVTKEEGGWFIIIFPFGLLIA